MNREKGFNSFLELLNCFPDERSCHQYLAEKRWGGLMTCPYTDCGGEEAYVFKDGIRYKCKCCQRVYTVRKGTIFESTKLPLQKWFIGIYTLMHEPGMSSVRFAANYGMTQKTAWFVMQRIRTVLVELNESTGNLFDVVEVDEAYLGGKNGNRHWDKKVKQIRNNYDRHFKDKSTVLGMMQRSNRKVKVALVDNRTKITLTSQVTKNIKSGSTVMTDEWKGYNDVIFAYDRKIVNHKAKQYVNGECHTNTLEGYWSQMKRLIRDKHYWVSKRHVNKYIQQSACKYNMKDYSVEYKFEQFIQTCVGVRLKRKDLNNI